MQYLVLYSVNWKKNYKTVPSTSNTLLSHLIGNLLPGMKVEYIGTVFKLVFKTFSSWRQHVLCDRTPTDCHPTWKRGRKRRDLSWFYCITLVSSCYGTSGHHSWSPTAAKKHYLMFCMNSTHSTFLNSSTVQTHLIHYLHTQTTTSPLKPAQISFKSSFCLDGIVHLFIGYAVFESTQTFLPIKNLITSVKM